MKNDFFTILARNGKARAGEIETNSGKVKTPVFMPVGTVGSVKAVGIDDLMDMKTQIILGNTYHLYLRPGDELIRELGGLHEFMRWKGPILTDSGGYQVSSLGLFGNGRSHGVELKKTKIFDDGVEFWSHVDGSKHWMDAEKSIRIQHNLGSDIIMAFDEATPDMGSEYASEAMKRTHKWLVRCVSEWKKLGEQERVGELFGIIQGGNYQNLRVESAKFILSQELSGVAIGGGNIGQSMEKTEEEVGWVRDLIPYNKPLYLMGLGVKPSDLLTAVKLGTDMVDCVAPTRIARMGGLYTGTLRLGDDVNRWRFESENEKERINIANARYRSDKKVIDENCGCYTCSAGYSRAYLRHLFKSSELLYYRLASIHNLNFMLRIMDDIREGLLGFGKDGYVGKDGERQESTPGQSQFEAK